MGSYTATYRIPKDRVVVRILLRDQTMHQFELFVPIRQERRPPGQILRELLEQDKPFFPGRDLDADNFVLLHRDSVVWAAAEKDPERELDHLDLFDHKLRVRVQLAIGMQLEGSVYYTAPSAHARLMDYLNGSERFVFLHSDDRLVLVNKRYVDFVTELPPRSTTRRLPSVPPEAPATPEEPPEGDIEPQPDTEETRGED
jgi:hypothetical protein